METNKKTVQKLEGEQKARWGVKWRDDDVYKKKKLSRIFSSGFQPIPNGLFKSQNELDELVLIIKCSVSW